MAYHHDDIIMPSHTFLKLEELRPKLEDYRQELMHKPHTKLRRRLNGIKHFKDHWNPDTNDFEAMLDAALKGADTLLTSKSPSPKAQLLSASQKEPGRLKQLLTKYYDEDSDENGYFHEMRDFHQSLESLIHNCLGEEEQKWSFRESSVLLVCLSPNRYFMMDITLVNRVLTYWVQEDAKDLKEHDTTDKSIRNGFYLYSEIARYLRSEKTFNDTLSHYVSDIDLIDPRRHVCAWDFVDFSFSTSNSQTDTEESVQAAAWWLVDTPEEWKASQISEQNEIQYKSTAAKGKHRKGHLLLTYMSKNDPVIIYASQPLKAIKAWGKVIQPLQDGHVRIEKVADLTEPVPYERLKNDSDLKDFAFFDKHNSIHAINSENYRRMKAIMLEANPDLPTNISALDHQDKYTRERFLREVYMNEEEYDRLTSVLSDKKNIILQGPPGVGKTFSARRLAYAMMGEQDNDRIGFVQFHENYAYEDFVLGFKPTKTGFVLKDGIFYSFCKKAEQDPERDYFFIIDEINRGNLSKILGELLVLIEKDYRGTEMTLSYDHRPFTVPENIYLIGMMNTADRSLAMIDYALRRRFSFIEMSPGFESNGFRNYRLNLHSKLFDKLVQKVIELNKAIASDSSLGPGFMIGHSFFCGLDDINDESIYSIVEYDLLPILQEYWFDDNDQYEKWVKELRNITAKH